MQRYRDGACAQATKRTPRIHKSLQNRPALISELEVSANQGQAQTAWLQALRNASYVKELDLNLKSEVPVLTSGVLSVGSYAAIAPLGNH